MTFLIDIPGAISVALTNPGPLPALGPISPIMIPVGDWKIQTDGIVVFALGESALNPDLAEILFPEMAEYVFRATIPLSFNLSMANIGTCRVNFYPRAPDVPTVQEIRTKGAR